MKSTRSNDRFSLARVVVYFVSLLFIGSTFGQPLNIVVFNAQYSTSVQAWSRDTNNVLTTISRTTVSASPISDEVDSPWYYGSNLSTNHAIANAGLFEVSVHTDFFAAGASATNQLWFSPLVDQTQAVGIQIDMAGALYNGGLISLQDLTANSELWNYGWSYPGTSNNIPGGASGARFNVETEFLASHQYELTMTTRSYASTDSESVDIQLTGLQVVPEPSSACLLLVALLGWRHFAATSASRSVFHRLGPGHRTNVRGPFTV